MAKNYAYLIQVNEQANNNKFYEVTENDDNTVSVRYGRVGGKEMEKDYGYQKNFWSLVEEKLRKGYEDRTALHADVQKSSGLTEELSYQPVEDEKVQELLDLLISSSREFMQKNYTVKGTEVTQKMIDEAQADLNSLSTIASNSSPFSLYQFNEKLKELFTDVPRKMNKVADYLAQTEFDFDKIIQRETEMLDNLRGIVMQTKDVSKETKDTTVLEACGLDIRPVTYAEEDQILSHLGKDYDGRDVENRYRQAFAVENHATRAAYEAYKQEHHISKRDVKLFYHGSKVENWYSIAKTGLLLNPKAQVTGKMFGQGLYFAPECRKSLNYMDTSGSHWNGGTRDTGYCAVYAVAIGKAYEPTRILGSSFYGSDLPKGYDSVFASKHNPHLGLRNDEYIVYDQSACTIKYLMEISKQNVRTKEFNLDRNALRSQLSDSFDKLIKTPEGMKAELSVEMLPQKAQAEICSKITDNFDCDRLFVQYNAKSDRISLSVVSISGDSMEIAPNLTRDDYAFLSREMKKSFVESENAWKELVEASSEYRTGEIVANKHGIAPHEDKSKKHLKGEHENGEH